MASRCYEEEMFLVIQPNTITYVPTVWDEEIQLVKLFEESFKFHSIWPLVQQV